MLEVLGLVQHFKLIIQDQNFSPFTTPFCEYCFIVKNINIYVYIFKKTKLYMYYSDSTAWEAEYSVCINFRRNLKIFLRTSLHFPTLYWLYLCYIGNWMGNWSLSICMSRRERRLKRLNKYITKSLWQSLQ